MKLLEKVFTEDEIKQLKKENGDSRLTTYDVFLAHDAKTLNCEHFHSGVEGDTYVGQVDEDNMMSGVGIWTKTNGDICYGTFEGDLAHGFLLCAENADT